MRIGSGYDFHRFVDGRRLVLGGVEIPYVKGLEGHSDADVLIHAICDALLGAAGEGDVGAHFPPTDPAFKDISSVTLLSTVADLLSKKGWAVSNVDATVIAEEPTLVPFKEAMARTIAKTLKISEDQVNIKATTTEGTGSIGRKEAIAAQAVALLEEKKRAKA